MAADGERRWRKGQINGGREVGRRGHQRGGAEGACLLKFNDRSVDAWRETKVVRVDDQAFHFCSVPRLLFALSCIKGSIRVGLYMKTPPQWRTIHTVSRQRALQ